VLHFDAVFGRASPAQILVTIALMVSMPLCCCNLRSIARFCTPVDASQTTDHNQGGADGPKQDRANCCHGGDNSTTPTGAVPNGPSRDGRVPCPCGKSLTTMGIVGDGAVEIPMLSLVAIQAVPTVLTWTSEPSKAVRMSTAGPPPPTSLLRLHCSLTV
jgi:hypothetical protein